MALHSGISRRATSEADEGSKGTGRKEVWEIYFILSGEAVHASGFSSLLVFAGVEECVGSLGESANQ